MVRFGGHYAGRGQPLTGVQSLDRKPSNPFAKAKPGPRGAKLAAAKAPPEAWLATNKGQQTPAHRLCLNVAAPVRLEMLKAAAKHAPPAVWSMKNKGGATPLEALMTKRMSAVREKTPSISPWVAQMMTDPSPKSRKGGGAAGRGGGGVASGGGAGAAVKLAAARHFFAMGAAGACKLDTGVPVPIQRLDDTRIQMRREVQRQRKGSGIELRHKQSVFAEVKYLISTELDRLPEAKDLPETKDPSERYFKGATGTKEAKQKGAALATHHPSPTHAHPAQPGHAVELSLLSEPVVPVAPQASCSSTSSCRSPRCKTTTSSPSSRTTNSPTASAAPPSSPPRQRRRGVTMGVSMGVGLRWRWRGRWSRR